MFSHDFGLVSLRPHEGHNEKEVDDDDDNDDNNNKGDKDDNESNIVNDICKKMCFVQMNDGLSS